MSEASPVKKPAAKKPAEHPKYIDMVKAAIIALKERNGSSRQAIGKYIASQYKVGDKIKYPLNKALKQGVASGVLLQKKGTGASGSFKVAEVKAPKKVAKKVAKPKKAAAKAKKPAAKKVKKTPKKAPKKKAVKSSPKKAAKKPAAKKTPAKKPAAKKAPAKKAAAKKPAAKKAVKKVKAKK